MLPKEPPSYRKALKKYENVYGHTVTAEPFIRASSQRGRWTSAHPHNQHYFPFPSRLQEFPQEQGTRQEAEVSRAHSSRRLPKTRPRAASWLCSCTLSAAKRKHARRGNERLCASGRKWWLTHSPFAPVFTEPGGLSGLVTWTLSGDRRPEPTAFPGFAPFFFIVWASWPP